MIVEGKDKEERVLKHVLFNVFKNGKRNIGKITMKKIKN